MSSQVEEGFVPTEPGWGADASLDAEAEEAVEAEAEATEEAEDQESEAESPTADEENVEKKTDPVQERIDKLTKNWRETERALEALQRENAKLLERVRTPVRQEPIKTLADFEYDERQYQEYLFDRAEQRARQAAEEAIHSSRVKDDTNEVLERFAQRERDFAKEHPDYQEVVYARELRINDDMADVIRLSDDGVELAYYLGKNPDEAKRIDRLPAAAAGRELGILEAQLRAERAKASRKKTVSDAPPPPTKKLGGGDSAKTPSTASPESDKLSDEEWARLERKRIAKLRG